MEINKALLAVKEKCLELGLDPQMVGSLYRQMLSEKLYFAYFPSKDTDGLTNDIGTQAVPVFSVDSEYHVSVLDGLDGFLGGRE